MRAPPSLEAGASWDVLESDAGRDIVNACRAVLRRPGVDSVKTVERHRANIREKPGMRDRVELTRRAIRRGLVEP